jgi:hypothetical protein
MPFHYQSRFLYLPPVSPSLPERLWRLLVCPYLYFPRSSVAMAFSCRGLLALALVASSAVAQNSTNSTNSTIDANYDVLTYVNQLIGSSNGGK